MNDFDKFYRHQSTTMEDIKGALDNLFLETCGPWYDNRGHSQPHDLSEDYRRLLNLTPEKLRHGFLALGASISTFKNDKFQFQSLSSKRIFTNPLALAVDQPQWISTYVCTTHGDFNSHNILLDDYKNTWLIDFLRTGQGHILHDISELNSIVRFDLLAGTDATLDERLAMEEALSRIDHFTRIRRLSLTSSSHHLLLPTHFS